MTKKTDANIRYKLTSLWCNLYHRYHDSMEYDKASTSLKFARQAAY